MEPNGIKPNLMTHTVAKQNLMLMNLLALWHLEQPNGIWI